MTARTVTIWKGHACGQSVLAYISYISYNTSAIKPPAQKPVKRAYGDQADRSYLKRKKGRP